MARLAARTAGALIVRSGSPVPAAAARRPGLDDGRTGAGVVLPVVMLVRTRDEAPVVGHLGPTRSPTIPTSGSPRPGRAPSPTGRPSAALLDQRDVAGLGTMWAQEVLSSSAPARGAFAPPATGPGRRAGARAARRNSCGYN